MNAEYSNFLETFGFPQIISRPTRVIEASATLIDHILCSLPELVFDINVVISDLSKNDAIQCPLLVNAAQTLTKIVLYGDIRHKKV